MPETRTPFWSAQDEAEYIRQEQQRIKKMRDAAFSAGFDAGAAWASLAEYGKWLGFLRRRQAPGMAFHLTWSSRLRRP